MIHILKINQISSVDTVINTTSRSKDFGRGLSPFLIGPCKLWGNHIAKNVENAWQFSKVYQNQTKADWLKWAKKGWQDSYAHRYPMGKGAIPKYSYWDGKILNYIEARKRIYIPLYCRAVRKTEAWTKLKNLAVKTNFNLALKDFDAYDHRRLGYSLYDVINDEKRKMGHAFVLALMLKRFRLSLILKGVL